MKVFERIKTRRERQEIRRPNSVTLPVSVCCINFDKEINVAHVMRSMACFGAKDLFVIGNVNAGGKALRAVSGSVNHCIRPIVFSTPNSWIQYCRERNVRIIALECPSDHTFGSRPIHELEPDEREICLVVGHETSGVPVEILKAGECHHIDMRGFAPCLNTSQAANIGLYEMSKKFLSEDK